MPIVNVNGINLYYEVTGTGYSVVLCHGYTGSHQDWMFQVPPLSQDHQVVVMDYRGHGSSEAPSPASAYSIPILAEDVNALLDHLAIAKCCLVGHSLGGFVALQLAVDQPSLVHSLVLVDTSSEWIEMPGYPELQIKLNQIARTEGMEAVFEYNAQRNPLSQKCFARYPRLREISKRRIVETSVSGYVYVARAIGQWQPLTPRLKGISAPTLVVVGEEDTPFLQPSEFLARSIPNSRLHVIPGATHSPQVETPDLFNQILLSFLAQVAPTSR
jgi:3-oxoadipate enol-lactonase